MRGCIDEDDIVMYKVESVVDHKIQNNKSYFKIRWADWSQEFDSWEEETTLKTIKPLIDLYKQKNGSSINIQYRKKQNDEEEKESVLLKKNQKNDISYGHFKYGDIPDKIRLIEINRNIKTQKNELNCIVEWKERISGEKPKCSVFSNNHLKKKAPNVLIDYYESKIILMSDN